MRRLIDTMSVPKCQHHHVCLNRQFQSDIQWWSCFLPQWNGRTILPPQQAAHSFWSDASGTWGCGALALVQGPVARVVATDSHCGQGDGPSSPGCGSLGTRLEVIHGPGIFRQHGSSLCSLIGLGTRPSPHASVTVLALLHSTLPDSHPSSAHSRCT